LPLETFPAGPPLAPFAAPIQKHKQCQSLESCTGLGTPFA
jgi:hypothetical protein